MASCRRGLPSHGQRLPIALRATVASHGPSGLLRCFDVSLIQWTLTFVAVIDSHPRVVPEGTVFLLSVYTLVRSTGFVI